MGFIVITRHVDRCHLQRIHRDDLRVHPALIALDCLAFLHSFIDINDNRVIVFGRQWP